MDKAALDRRFLAAARAAVSAFGLADADLELVHAAENLTFRVTSRPAGGVYALRVHRPGYHSAESLRSERVWTQALLAAGIPTPPAVPTPAGAYHVPVDVAGEDGPRQASLCGWVAGVPLAEVLKHERGPAALRAHFERLGVLLATLHVQAETWQPPPGFVRHRLDIEGLLGETPFWGRFWEHPLLDEEERARVLRMRDALRARLTALGPAHFSVIHADLHPGNVLVDAESLCVIDFDDAGWGWHGYDLAAALATLQSRGDFSGLANACLSGYASQRPLPLSGDADLRMFLLLRDLATLGWFLQRPEIDGSRYLPVLKARILRQAPA